MIASVFTQCSISLALETIFLIHENGKLSGGQQECDPILIDNSVFDGTIIMGSVYKHSFNPEHWHKSTALREETSLRPHEKVSVCTPFKVMACVHRLNRILTFSTLFKMRISHLYPNDIFLFGPARQRRMASCSTVICW